MYMLAGLILLIFGLIGLHVYIRYSKNGRLMLKIPGPTGIPIFGNVFEVYTSRQEDFFTVLDPIIKKYYPIFKLWGGTLSGACILTAEDAEVLLTSNKHINKSLIYKFLRPWLAEGLLVSRDAKWHHRRKILTPAFHFNVLQKYFTILDEHGDQIVQSLNDDGKEKVVDLAPFFTYHTLSAIFETAMGVSFKNVDPVEIEQYKEASFFLGEQLFYRFLKPWFYIDFLFDNFTWRGWKQKKYLKILHNFTQKIIKERTEYHRKTEGKYLQNIATSYLDDDDDISKGKKKRLAMLDLLIAASWEGLIDEQGIAEEVDTFVFEGHDTSSMALVFTIQLLAEHEDIQKKARDEINEIWDSCNGKLNMNTLNKLPYLERCIKESLRLYPSVHFVSREIPEDIKLNTVTVPAGTMLHVDIYEVQRDPKHWPEPNKFDPDRFLPENMVDRHPFAYIPFSAGPRNCIGQRFAMMEMKMFTLYILRHFQLKSLMKSEDLGRLVDLVYRPMNNVNVKFTPIKKIR